MKNKISFNKKTEYGREYSDFTGIDTRSEGTDDTRTLPYAVNMYRDYYSDRGKSIETVPGYRLLGRFSQRINGMHSALFDGEEYLLVHSGEELFAFQVKDRDRLSEEGVITRVEGCLLDGHSEFFSFRDNLYILDGNGYYKVVKNSEGFLLVDMKSLAYIPTVRYNGERYMERNLLGGLYKEKFNLLELQKCSGVYGLSVNEYDTENSFCEVSAISPNREYVYIPSELVINGRVLYVKRICAGAFSFNRSIKQLVVASGVERIEGGEGVNGAFEGCTNLQTVVLHGVTYIGNRAFSGCRALRTLFLSRSLQNIASNALEGCVTLSKGGIYYTGDEYDLSLIKNLSYEAFSFDAVLENVRVFIYCELFEAKKGSLIDTGVSISEYPNTFKRVGYADYALGEIIENGETWAVSANEAASFSMLGFRSESSYIYIGFTISDGETALTEEEYQSYIFELSEGCESVESVSVDGMLITQAPSFETGTLCNYYLNSSGGYVKSIIINAREGDIRGKDIVITEKASKAILPRNIAAEAFLTDCISDALDIVVSCEKACVFDGRIFFTGSKKAPDTVFYISDDEDGIPCESYIGEESYVALSQNGRINKALIAHPLYLAVIKEGDGGVFCLKKSGKEYKYSVEEGVSGIGCVSCAKCFYDDPVFISENGLEALVLPGVGFQRNIKHRSSRIDRLLLGGYDLSNARLAVFCGYLVVSVEGAIFLADSRAMTDGEYQWYFLDEVYTYSDDKLRYHYLSVPIKGLPGEYRIMGDERYVEYDDVYSDCLEDGSVITYVSIEGEKYAVDTDGERYMGIKHPICEVYSDGDKLFIGSDDGALCIFNNDKRGESFFVGETEESVDKSEIHRAYYNRMGHRYVAGFSTLNDDCALKGISKNTVTGSLVLKIASSIGLSFEVKVRSDREGWHSVERFSGGDHSFYGTDFSSFSFDIGKTALLICHERLRRWCEKQYYIYSDGYNTPFGVYSISYRWRVSGRLRERDV